MNPIGLRVVVADVNFIAPNLLSELANTASQSDPQKSLGSNSFASFFRQMETELPQMIVSVPSRREQEQVGVFFDNLDLRIQPELGTIEDIVKRCTNGAILLKPLEGKNEQVHAGNVLVMSDNLHVLLKLREEKACQTVFCHHVIRTLDRIRRLMGNPAVFEFSIDNRREFSRSEVEGLEKSYFWDYFQTRYPVMSIDYYEELIKLLNQPVGWLQERVEGVVFSHNCAFCTDTQSIHLVDEIVKLEIVNPSFPRKITPNVSTSAVPYDEPLLPLCSHGNSEDPQLLEAMIASTQEALLYQCAPPKYEDDDADLRKALEQSVTDQTHDPAICRALSISSREQIVPTKSSEDLRRVLRLSMEEQSQEEDVQRALRLSITGSDSWAEDEEVHKALMESLENG